MGMGLLCNFSVDKKLKVKPCSINLGSQGMQEDGHTNL